MPTSNHDSSIALPALTLDEWLNLPVSELAAIVEQFHLVLFFSIDGSQRHYYLSHPEAEGKLTNFTEYARATAKAYVDAYEVCFGLGINTIMTPFLIDNNFARSLEYTRNAISFSTLLLKEPPFTDLYQRWDVKARLWGDYEFAPLAEPVREEMLALHADLTALTPSGNRLLLCGYQAGSITEEIVFRTTKLAEVLGRPPTEQELFQSWLPEGPDRVNLMITAGWTVTGGLLPAVFANQVVDTYNLDFLALDLKENHLRRILYDYLYRRGAAPYDGTTYAVSDLAELNEYYQKHQNCMVGIGTVVGPGMWYPDHDHKDKGTSH